MKNLTTYRTFDEPRSRKNPTLSIAAKCGARWPRRLTAALASAYMCLSDYHFRKDEKLMAIGYKANGATWWDKEDLDRFVDEEKALAAEAAE